MEEIIRLIHGHEHFIIAGHTGPDGDAIGSCFGLAWALEAIGKKPLVVLEPFVEKYNVIPGCKFLYHGTPEELDVNVLIALDCADPGRLGAARPLFDRAKHTVCIDHHETNKGFADYNYIDAKASSTAEMVFRLIEKLTAPNKDIAAAIYAGIISDTGGFRYNATAKSTMETAAQLMDIGIPFAEIYRELMHVHRFAAVKAMGLALNNCRQAMDGRIVYSSITREMLDSVGACYADLDGVVEYLMGTRGAEVACLICEKQPAEIKVSLRSNGPNVGNVAVALGGGGHHLAAGATVDGDMNEIIQRTLALLTQEILTHET